ncbi:MAG: branched-chain amino acid aminotransferase [Sphingomonas sp.]
MSTILDQPRPAAAAISFETVPHPNPTPPTERAARIADPGFGRVFTDHMAVVRFSEGKGWHSAQIAPRGTFALDPAAAVLHYAQEIFEGLKAYRHPDGRIALFRPDANAARMVASAGRMAMEPVPPALFLEAVKRLVQIDKDWMPDVPGGSLYLRPFQISTEAFLGVKPSTDYIFGVIASSVGDYFKGGAKAVSLWVSKDYTRAAPGGTGAAKCGGNYAASLIALGDATRRGFDQVLFLDAAERRWIEELGGMNVFFVFADGTLLTPPLTGTILPGITRDTVIQLARAEGLTVREERYAIDQARADAESGRLVEAFACGTAAVVAPIGSMSMDDGSFTIGSGGPGQTTARLRKALVDIQFGHAPDTHGWIVHVA